MPEKNGSQPPHLRILVTTVDLDSEGGVAAYLRAIQHRSRFDVQYAYVGKRPGERQSVRTAVGRLLKDYANFWRTLRYTEYDCVHLNPSLNLKALLRDAGFLMIARCKRVPTLVFVHGWDEACERLLRRQPWNWLFARTYLRATHIAVLAEQFKASLRDMGFQGPITVTTVAVDAEIVEAGARPGRPNSLNSEVRLLFMARLEIDKGPLTAIRVAEQLAREGRPVRITVAGDGPASDEVRRLASNMSHGAVECVGYVRGAGKLAVLADADIFLYPTRYGEGMPVCVLEALTMGMPVITRPVGGVRDFFVDGKIGFLTESTAPVNFARLVRELVDKPELRRAMGQSARTYAVARFSPQAAAAALDHIYEATVRH